jgi:predicted alpha/beta-fold hydrolase
MMHIEQEERQITIEEALEMPEYADMHEAMRYAMNTPFKKMFPKKYEMSMNRTIARKTQEIFESNPSMPLKNVIATVLNSLRDDLDADFVLKMTQLIIKEWKELSMTISTNKRVEELV